MKILTWNFDGGGTDRWKYVLELDPDIALLQEVHDPEKHILPRDEYQRLSGHIAVNNNIRGTVKGNAIYSKHHHPRHLNDYYEGGRVLIAEMPLANGDSLIIINIHVKTGDYVSNLHSVLDYLAGTNIMKASKNLIVGGDLNLDVVYGRTNRPAHQRPVDRLINEFNLINCTVTSDMGRVNTIRGSIWQDDYIFLSRNIADRVNIEVFPGLEKSRHFPVVATLEGI